MKCAAQAGNARLILCDPVCVFPYGHNVAAMVNFRNFVGRYFDEVISIGCQFLPKDIAKSRKIETEFSYYYNDAMPLPVQQGSTELLGRHNDKLEAAKSDIIKLLDRHKVTGRDILCYPSVDFYSLHALVAAIEELKSAGAPTIMLRLIGVMETAASGAYARPMNVVLALINQLKSSGLPLKLAAETPRYADYLAMHLNCPVAVTANIETHEQMPLPEGRQFTAICPGSSRYDKGFLELREIFTKVRRHDPDMKIRFVTQLLPDRELQHQLDYLQQLYSIPGVKILPSQISADEMADMYAQADIVLMPYAPDVYELRGSAALIEATCSGRHVLAFEGPAFVDQMRYFGSGTACKGTTDMAEKIIELSRQSPQLRYARARQSRERFVKDLNASYRDWVS